MKRYAIARYLSEEARRAACSADWKATELTSGTQSYRAGTNCPLGIAIEVDGYCLNNPDPCDVADALVYLNERRSYEAACHAAQTFITDWDMGRLTPNDLPIALGIKP